MGAVFLSGTLKSKTYADALKEIGDLQEEAIYETGNDPYSGGINNLYNFKYITVEFMGRDDLVNYMETRMKGDGVVARVRVAEDTAVIKRWVDEYNKIFWVRHDETPSEYRTRQRKVVKLREKINKARMARLEKSKKTVLMYAGWVSH